DHREFDPSSVFPNDFQAANTKAAFGFASFGYPNAALVFSLELTNSNLQRAQEVHQVLLVRGAQCIEIGYRLVRFRCWVGGVAQAVVIFDCGHDVVSAAIVHEPEALSNTPQRRSA